MGLNERQRGTVHRRHEKVFAQTSSRILCCCACLIVPSTIRVVLFPFPEILGFPSSPSLQSITPRVIFRHLAPLMSFPLFHHLYPTRSTPEAFFLVDSLHPTCAPSLYLLRLASPSSFKGNKILVLLDPTSSQSAVERLESQD